MASYLIGYTVIAIIIAFVVFSILVKKRVLFGETVGVQKVFGHPLLHYSLRRIGSSLISIALAIIVTFLLVRLAYPVGKVCSTFFNNPRSPLVNELRCNNWKAEMGFSGSIFQQLFTFFYNLLPFPKTLCQTSIGSDSAGGVTTIVNN